MSETLRRIRVRAQRTVAALSLALALVPSRAEAEDPSALTADDVVRLVIESNPTVRAAVLELRRGERLVNAERARYGWTLRLDGDANVGSIPSLSQGSMGGTVIVPTTQTFQLGAQIARALPAGTTVTARLQASRSFRRVQLLPNQPTTVTLGPGYGMDLVLSVTQPLLRGAGRAVGYAARDAARFDRERLLHAAERQASTVLVDTLAAYYELWYSMRALAIETAARDLAARQRDDAEARRTIGAVAGPDVLALDAQVASLEESVVARESEIAQRTAALARLVGLGGSGGEAPSLVPEQSPEGDVVETTNAVEAAAEASPELAELRAQIDAAERQARIAADSLRPRLDVSANLTAHGLGYDDVGAAARQLGTFDAVQFTANVIYEAPLNTTRLHEERARAELAVQVARENYEAAYARIVADVRTQLAALEAAQRRVELANRTVEVSRRLAEAQAERYAIGTVTVTVALEAANDLREAELRRARALVDLREASVRLAHLTGGLVAPYANALVDGDE